jgi:hypothetical protein
MCRVFAILGHIQFLWSLYTLHCVEYRHLNTYIVQIPDEISSFVISPMVWNLGYTSTILLLVTSSTLLHLPRLSTSVSWSTFLVLSFSRVPWVHGSYLVSTEICFHTANPTVRGIQQCSKQPHHPGVSDPPPRFFFFDKFIGKMLYFSANKRDSSLTS